MHNAQAQLFEVGQPAVLSTDFWRGCFNAKESSMQQLAPYVGKMKSGMARALILAYSSEGNTVLDPFCGSGVVPYEAMLLGRHAIGNDLNPYAYVLTLGKFSAPRSLHHAIHRAEQLITEAESVAPRVDLKRIPIWVRRFFHPRTLKETLALFRILRTQKEYFLMACLLGILHHVRPGFLSYPSSHLVPYLRVKKYPRKDFPRMYAYRDLRSRLLAKIQRAYKRHEPQDPAPIWRVFQENAMCLPLKDESVDAIISSPPYYGALDYGRDNRLRLWFLGLGNYKALERRLTSEDSVYVPQMARAVDEMCRLVKLGGRIVLVLGNYSRNGSNRDSAETVRKIAQRNFPDALALENILVDPIPDERRSRRRTKTTQHETIIVFRKSGSYPGP